MYGALGEPDPLRILTEHLHQHVIPPPQANVRVAEPSFLQVFLQDCVSDNVSLLDGGEGVGGGGTQLAQRDP